jgi:glycosyltransferase involved in cell wall biosynthesis
MKTILATTYAVNPNKGSEDGTGWNFILQIARFNKVIAITRENNQAAIEAFQKAHPDVRYENIEFRYFDLPYWMRFWKKGGRGAMLYYWMWQRAIPSFVRKANINFDIAHNVNFHNDWTPSFLWKLNKPFVWGPIGHHEAIPNEFVAFYGVKQQLRERVKLAIKKYFWKYNTALKKAVKNSSFVYAMNDTVHEAINLQNVAGFTRPSIASFDYGYEASRKPTDGLKLITAGRFVALKGFDLAIESFAAFVNKLEKPQRQKCSLTIVGKGPEEHRLVALINKLGMEQHIKLIKWMERNELMNEFKSSDAFLFPSHEGAGMVVAEALSFGLPVICLEKTGPAGYINESCGYVVSKESRKKAIDGLSQAITNLYITPDQVAMMRRSARRQFMDIFHWDRRGEWLQEIYSQV